MQTITFKYDMMFTTSIWNSFAATTPYPELRAEVETETLIIGGGITGISLAMSLSQSGHRCIVAESYKIGEGSSSHSTGNLYVPVDSGLAALAAKYDTALLRRVTTARRAALDQMARHVRESKLQCDFVPCAWHLGSADGTEAQQLQKELEAAHSAGLALQSTPDIKAPLPVAQALVLPGQAQVNPRKYIQQLARACQPAYLSIYEHTPVLRIHKQENGYEIHTPAGRIKARQVVHATHTPKGFMTLQTLLGPYREYGIAYKLRAPLSEAGIFWIYEGGEKYSIRHYEADGLLYLLIVGKKHKVGQGGDSKKYILELEQFARAHFGLEEAAFRWSGQHYRPADLLPYIGAVDEGLYVATGYATDGLVYGTLAATMISRQIRQEADPWQDLFDPLRKSILKSAGNFIKENLNVVGQYLKLIPGLADDVAFADIHEGEGHVVDKDGHKLAVYRAHDRKLVIKSAICPHLGCVVQFNQAEQTWDCPCHGSRFDTDGAGTRRPCA